jgi:hypothetical protein
LEIENDIDYMDRGLGDAGELSLHYEKLSSAFTHLLVIRHDPGRYAGLHNASSTIAFPFQARTEIWFLDILLGIPEEFRPVRFSFATPSDVCTTAILHCKFAPISVGPPRYEPHQLRPYLHWLSGGVSHMVVICSCPVEHPTVEDSAVQGMDVAEQVAKITKAGLIRMRALRLSTFLGGRISITFLGRKRRESHTSSGVSWISSMSASPPGLTTIQGSKALRGFASYRWRSGEMRLARRCSTRYCRVGV